MKTISQEVTISKSQRRDEIAAFQEQAARIAALEAALNPREWTAEMNHAWHAAIPDTEAAFRALRDAARAAAPAPEGE